MVNFVLCLIQFYFVSLSSCRIGVWLDETWSRNWWVREKVALQLEARDGSAEISVLPIAMSGCLLWPEKAYAPRAPSWATCRNFDCTLPRGSLMELLVVSAVGQEYFISFTAFVLLFYQTIYQTIDVSPVSGWLMNFSSGDSEKQAMFQTLVLQKL